MTEGTVETRDTASDRGAAREPVPGVVLVYCVTAPTCIAARGDVIVLGRESFGGALEDPRTSREHARVRVGKSGFTIEDCGSRNGTFVDGERLEGQGSVAARPGAIVRIGQSVCMLVDDVTRFETPRPFERDSAIVGPSLARAHDQIARAAAEGESVLFLGETGSGKELAAKVFHEATERSGALVAVNCAAIPTGVAERLFFGAKRGAYSGADADADGYMQAADKGTLFLDEIAELDPLIQAKLLRALETKEVTAVGAARPRKVDVRVCSATHKDLRGEIAGGRFRQDLYFRIGRPEIAIPPLRARREEIPWLVRSELASRSMTAHAGFVEACMLREWPGNVRELLVETRSAAHEARGREETEVRASDLAEGAGRGIVGHALDSAPSEAGDELVVNRRGPPLDPERVRRALAEHQGNVTAAARALGIHRNQLRRWIDKQE